MTLTETEVEELVEYILQEYRKRTNLEEWLEVRRQDSRRADFEEYRREFSVEQEDFGSGVWEVHVNQQMPDICGWEEGWVLHGFETEAGSMETVEEGFEEEFLDTVVGCVETPRHVFLPDQPGYRTTLRSTYDITDRIPYNQDIPIHWFNPTISGQRGFVTNDRVAVFQRTQGSVPMVGSRLDIQVQSREYRDDEILVYLSDGGFGELKIELWTELSPLITTDEESVCEIRLPDPTTIQP